MSVRINIATVLAIGLAGVLMAASVKAGAESGNVAPPGAPLVAPGRDGKLNYAPAANGDVIPDFSNCGYMGGGVKIPVVPVKITLKPIEKPQDDTARIQQAIDQVSKMPADKNGHRGAVLLTRGTYRIESQLKIVASGVVLR